MRSPLHIVPFLSATTLLLATACAAPIGGGSRWSVEDAGAPQSDEQPAARGDGGASQGACKLAPGRACSTDPQCGCAAAEACDVVAEDGAVACRAAGKVEVGGACASSAQCAEGSTCMMGVCHAFCEQGACANGGTCFTPRGPSGTPVPNLRICTLPCTLDAPTECGAGSCYYFAGIDATDCGRAAPQGTTSCAGSDWACPRGMVCLSDDACRPWCRVGSSCGARPCAGFATPLWVDGVEYGVCP